MNIEKQSGSAGPERKKKTETEADLFDFDFIAERLDEGVCPTNCPEGCVVEPDGVCPHDFESAALECGLI